jgi:hypothetical protein
MTSGELADRHPRLYHVTTPGPVCGMIRHGLLPTSSLLDLFEIVGEQRVGIEAKVAARAPGLIPQETIARPCARTSKAASSTSPGIPFPCHEVRATPSARLSVSFDTRAPPERAVEPSLIV